jgi:hypothetical protein
MIINKDSIKVNSVSWGQYLVEVKFGYHKIWSKDSGRNLAGAMSGTLKGIFPKITMQFRALTKTELETISSVLDSATQSLQYYDPSKKANVTITTYTGDWEIINKNIINAFGKNEGFSIAFISTKKR